MLPPQYLAKGCAHSKCSINNDPKMSKQVSCCKDAIGLQTLASKLGRGNLLNTGIARDFGIC